jgi:hypothetical protein
MGKLTEDEKREWQAVAKRELDAPPLNNDERFVAPTVEARARYIRFATQAARLFRGDKPSRPEGQHWKL